MCACQWTDLLLELELLTRIARLALTQKNYDLVYMHTCTCMLICPHTLVVVVQSLCLHPLVISLCSYRVCMLQYSFAIVCVCVYECVWIIGA